MTRGSAAVRGLTLDAGALIAIDRGDEDIRALLRRARAHEWPIVIPAGALAQAWRGGARQARLAGFLRARRDKPALHPLNGTVTRTAGELCGRTGTTLPGRYLFVVVAEAGRGGVGVYVVTAREMIEAERRRFRRKAR